MRKPLGLAVAYRLINHGPVVIVSSLHDGATALTPIAWHMPVSDEPPIIALEVWEGHFLYGAIMQTKDFAVNIPSHDMVEEVRRLGGVSAKKVDKVREFGIAMEASRTIASPRMTKAIGVMECRLRSEPRLAEEYNVILGDVVYAEAEESVFSDRWLTEKAGPRTLHHLGNKIFCVPEKKTL